MDNNLYAPSKAALNEPATERGAGVAQEMASRGQHGAFRRTLIFRRLAWLARPLVADTRRTDAVTRALLHRIRLGFGSRLRERRQ